jgi:hypothetical protein
LSIPTLTPSRNSSTTNKISAIPLREWSPIISFFFRMWVSISLLLLFSQGM